MAPDQKTRVSDAHSADRPHVVARPEHVGVVTEMFYEHLQKRRRDWDFLSCSAAGCGVHAPTAVAPPELQEVLGSVAQPRQRHDPGPLEDAPGIRRRARAQVSVNSGVSSAGYSPAARSGC